MSRPVVQLGDVAVEIDRFETVQPDRIYRLLGMRSKIGGPFLREIKSGSAISAKRLNKVCSGDFIYSRLFAWQGSFGIIPEELDGCYVSGEFPLFQIDGAKLSKDFLLFWFGLSSTQKTVEKNCYGATQKTRNRFKQDYFKKMQAPCLPIDKQGRIVARLKYMSDLAAQWSQILEKSGEEIIALRRSILDLALQGKLVEQNSADKPVFELLHQIQKEQEKRRKAGDIKKIRQYSPVKDGPFKIPANWAWIRLGQTGNIFSGNSINAETRRKLGGIKEGRPFVATKDVGYGYDLINYETGLTVPHSDESFRAARAYAVFICAEGGSAGRKIGMTDREICFGNKLLANESYGAVSPKFLRAVYLSEYFYSEFAQRMKGIIGGISINQFLQIPFPLPPLAEQKRIVAKVDELMALCDELEANLAARETARKDLMEAVLREAFEDAG